MVAVVVIGGLGILMVQSNQKESAMMEQKAMEEKTMMEEKAMMEKKAMEEKAAMESKDSAMMEKDGAMMKKDGETMMSKGSYELYDASKLAMAETGKVVLFFKASWCPCLARLKPLFKGGRRQPGIFCLAVK